MGTLAGALKSKTVWFGVAQIAAPYIMAWVNGMPVDWKQAATTVVTGAGTILLRFLTTQSLADKVKTDA